MTYIFHACVLQLVRSAQFCSVLFKVPLRDLGGVNRRLALQSYNIDMYLYKDDINVICELPAVNMVIWSEIGLVTQFRMLSIMEFLMY